MKKIMFVDDEEEICFAFEEFFEDQFKITATCDQNEALRLIGSDEEYVVLVSDLKMPGISGQELIEKARLLRPNLKVIIQTSFFEMDLLIESINSMKADGYICKPWVKKEDEIRSKLAWLIQDASC